MNAIYTNAAQSQVLVTLFPNDALGGHGGPCQMIVLSTWPPLAAAGVVIAPYVAPPPFVPQSVSMWQLQAVLAQQGLTAKVTAAVTAASATNPMISGLWASLALPITRTSPTLDGLATAAGITPAQLDALFIAAAAVTL